MRQPACIPLLLILAACRSNPRIPLTTQTQNKPPTPGTIQVGDFLATNENCGMVRYVRPVYPKERRAHIEGEVKLNIVIFKTGVVGNLDVVSGEPVLASAAMRAVKATAVCSLQDKWRPGGS